MEEILLYSIFYIFFAFCIIAPPTEFVSAGLTVQNMFGDYLGSEDLNFVYYHIRRTTATVLLHSLLPFGYYVILSVLSPELQLLVPWHAAPMWQYFLMVCIVYITSASLIAFYWSRKKWSNHPIAHQLSNLGNGDSWRAVASSINVEIRRIDKFTTGAFGNRVLVTDTWIVKTSAYFVNIAHQNDIHLSLHNTEEHSIPYTDTQSGAQYINIQVNSTNQKIKKFNIRLHSLEYGELREKLQAPVVNARNIVIKQTLGEQFLEEFIKQVDRNEPYQLQHDVEVENCIGCMLKESDVKLHKLCDQQNDGECQMCYCRPMWCLECMGKWFASRQDQHHPETWMNGKSPCPTCRAVFCLLDVCHVRR